MKILLDMNLSPQWKPILEQAGHACVHWVDVGSPQAGDYEILEWARKQEFVVLTLHLDLAMILTNAVLLRAQDPLPSAQARRILGLLQRQEEEFANPVILVLDEART